MTLLKPFVIIIKSILYYFFDSLALCSTPSPQKTQLEVVLLIRQDAIGDFVMWLDTAKEYRKLYPPDKYKIVLVGNKIWCDLAKKLPLWDEVLPVNVKAFKTLSLYRWNILREVRNFGAKIAIQPTFSREFYHGDSLIRASHALRKTGSVGDMNNRNWLKKTIADGWHTELIPTSTQIMTELERNAEFFSGILQKKYFLNYPKIEVSDSWEILECKKKEFYILSLGTDKNYREWPINFYAEIAQRIHEKTGWHGLICGIDKELNLGEQIQDNCDVPLENFAGRTSLTELAWLLSKSKILISNETGTAHIAKAVGTFTICISGGGHFGRFVPYPELPRQTNHLKVVYYKMPCYGCNWKCIYPINEGQPAPCIANINVDAVWEKVVPLLTN